jgi:sugar O-acyltransferase (sialic acid O-acetyltransferase NeuD family)
VNEIVIFGTGSFAQVAHYLFTHDSAYEVVGFTVHREQLVERQLFGLPVVPFEDVLTEFPRDRFEMFVAVGYSDLNRIRARIYAEAKSMGYVLPSYISSKATYWGRSVGDNCFICEDNTIQPFVEIGNDVILWSGNHVGHHSKIGDHCFVSSHVVICGHVTIEPYCFLGVNASIRDGISVAARNLIGAGALIMKSTREGELYVGDRTRPDPRTVDGIEI